MLTQTVHKGHLCGIFLGLMLGWFGRISRPDQTRTLASITLHSQWPCNYTKCLQCNQDTSGCASTGMICIASLHSVAWWAYESGHHSRGAAWRFRSRSAWLGGRMARAGLPMRSQKCLSQFSCSSALQEYIIGEREISPHWHALRPMHSTSYLNTCLLYI